jgi:hypothetical protein
MAEIYFSGQGKVYVATRDGSGNPGAFRDLGNIPALSLTLETDVLEHKESRTGSRLTDLRLVKDRKASVSMTLESFNVKNLQMLLYGTSQTGGGAVTNEASPSGLAVGDIVALASPHVSAVTVNTYTGGTAWVLDTDYSLDAVAGMITILSISKGTRIEVDYTAAASNIVPMFKDVMPERYLRFVGLNTANSNKVVTVELYRVAFDPANTFDLINDEIAQFELSGSVLYDSTRDANSVLGGFGRIVEAQ